MGSSSCFTVGLAKALLELKNKKITSYNLSKKIINFEQKIMKEIVGSQDQVAAAIGGFNKIIFNKDNSIQIKKIKRNKNISILESNLVLFYSGISRTAHTIASGYVNKLTNSKKEYIKNIIEHVDEGERIIMSKNIDDFGELLHSAWILKKKLSKSISNSKIDNLYEKAIKSGAQGGKLLGAGGGGFLLMYMKKNYRKKFLKKFPKVVEVPFKFSSEGSQVIFKNLNR